MITNTNNFFFLRTRLFFLLAFLIASWQPASAQQHETNVQVRLAGLANSRGTIRIAIFNRAEGFPATHTKAARLLNLPAQKGLVEFSLHGLARGQYAIAVYHDENNDGQLNTNLLGIPQEGYAFSNNVRPKFSAPSFQQTAFTLPETGQQLDIKVKY